MKIRDILLCWDFISSVLIGLMLLSIMPLNIEGIIIKDISSIGVSTLSIIFSVYFAALAIIISSSDDEFVLFLEEEGHFSDILQTFKYSLMMIFMTLIISIFLYFYLSIKLVSVPEISLNKYIFIFYLVAFVYSIFCVFNSTLDALKYAKYRTRYLRQIKSSTFDRANTYINKNNDVDQD